MSAIPHNLQRIRERIELAAVRANRTPADIRLIAVSKTHPPETIREAIAAGQMLFGENRVQDALPKIDALPADISWHFIGHLQSNKVRKALGRFSLFHGVDNLDLARHMDRIAGELGIEARILLEVNVSGEASKFGFAPDALRSAMNELRSLSRLQIEGLMTMAPYSEDPESARPHFARLRELRDALSKECGLLLQELSMGMSGDFEQGIAEGATIVRVGSAIFGEREAPGAAQG